MRIASALILIAVALYFIFKAYIISSVSSVQKQPARVIEACIQECLDTHGEIPPPDPLRGLSLPEACIQEC